MKVNNVRQIRAEDFEDDYAQLTSQLGTILNSFMQEVAELSDGRIDFENKVETIKTFDITVDSNGLPTQSPFRLNTNKSNIRGMHVIRAINITNSISYPESAPFITWKPIGGTLVEIQHITGLSANNKYKLTVITY